MKVLEHLYYTETEEWVKVEGTFATIGITDHAQEQMGGITYLQLPGVDEEFEMGQSIGVIDSSKTSQEVYAPLSGRIVKVNTGLTENPDNLERINKDPYGEGWLFQLEMTKPEEVSGLMRAAAYQEFAGKEE